MDILVPQIIFQMINFLVVLGLLSYLLYKPILEIFKERADRIEKGQKAAQEAIEQKEKIAQYEEKKRKELDKKVTAELETASKEADKYKDSLMEKAKDEVATYVEKQRQKWEQDRTEMLNQMQTSLVDTVVLATEKVLSKKLTEKDKEQLVTAQLQQALQEL